MDAILSFFRLEVLIGLSGGVALITQIIKAMPVEFTTNNPKKIAWVVASVIVGIIGYIEKADIVTIISVVSAVALVSHGLYDVVQGIFKK